MDVITQIHKFGLHKPDSSKHVMQRFILVFQTGFLQVLSEQMLMDCSWGFGNNACDGGEEWRSYEWIMKHGGIALAETYGPYMGMVRSPLVPVKSCNVLFAGTHLKTFFIELLAFPSASLYICQLLFYICSRSFLLFTSLTSFSLYQNGFCHVNSSELVAQIQSYTNVTSGDAMALKLALFKHGPVAVSIDASHRSFVFYSHGVYYEPACG